MTTGSVDGRRAWTIIVFGCGDVVRARGVLDPANGTADFLRPTSLAATRMPMPYGAERSDSSPLNPGTATGGRSLSPAFTQNHGRPFRARTMGEDAALPSVLLHVPASRAPPPVRRIADPRLAVDSTAAIVHARLQNLELGRA